ncbi:FAD-dependent oxidoreductase, partial [Mycobacterium sp. ITM-2017-0098]
LDPDAVRAVNPALRGKFLAALHCARDGAVESRQALPAIRAALTATDRYTFVPGTEARTVTDTRVGDDRGNTYDADVVIVCAGAA